MEPHSSALSDTIRIDSNSLNSAGAPKTSAASSNPVSTNSVMSVAIPSPSHIRLDIIQTTSEVPVTMPQSSLTRTQIASVGIAAPKQVLPPMTLPSFPHHLFGDGRSLEPPLSIWGISDLKLKSYNQQFVQLLGFDAAALAKRDLQIADLFALRGASQSEIVDSSKDRVIQAHTLLRTDEAKRIDVLLISLVTSASEFKTLQLTLVPLTGNDRVLWVTEDMSARAPSPLLAHQLSRSPSPTGVPTAKPVEYHFDSPPWKPKESVKKRERKERPWDNQMVKFTIEPPPSLEKPPPDKPQTDKPPMN